ncbi:hypothetical protein PG984_014417 [Apiospora sp. TS-2023a]
MVTKKPGSADTNTEATVVQPGSGKELSSPPRPQDGDRGMGPGDVSLCEKVESVAPFENKMPIPSAKSESASAKEEVSTFEVDNGPELSCAVDTATSETKTLGILDAVEESHSVDTADNKEETEQGSTDDSGTGWLCVIL